MQVTEAQIHKDLALDKFMWDHPGYNGAKSPRQDSIHVFKEPYAVCPLESISCSRPASALSPRFIPLLLTNTFLFV